MPASKIAVTRHRIIDNLLRNPYKRLNVQGLIKAVSEALIDEGVSNGISRRTLFYDLATMQEPPERGYDAPIDRDINDCYFYTDPDFSITKCPLVAGDAEKLQEALHILKQFKALPQFQGIEEIILKLEQKSNLKAKATNPVIEFEKTEQLKGLQYLQDIYKSILRKRTLSIQYQSFKAKAANSFLFNPYLLKEYNSRWFVVGLNRTINKVSILAIDRINTLSKTDATFTEIQLDEFNRLAMNMIGITVPLDQKIYELQLSFTPERSNYIKTKPIHQSQAILKDNKKECIITLNLMINKELISLLLSFGDDLKVVKPAILATQMKHIHQNAWNKYIK